MGRYWHMFLPILLLLGLLCFGFTPFLSGAACCVLILVLSLVRADTRLSLRGFCKFLEDCSLSVSNSDASRGVSVKVCQRSVMM